MHGKSRTASSDHDIGYDLLFRPYFDGLEKNELTIQQCARCNEHQWPPRSTCVHCLGNDMTWKRVDEPEGTIYTWVVVHHTTDPDFTGLLPYAVALINVQSVCISVFGLIPNYQDIEFDKVARFVPKDPSGVLPPHWRLDESS